MQRVLHAFAHIRMAASHRGGRVMRLELRLGLYIEDWQENRDCWKWINREKHYDAKILFIFVFFHTSTIKQQLHGPSFAFFMFFLHLFGWPFIPMTFIYLNGRYRVESINNKMKLDWWALGIPSQFRRHKWHTNILWYENKATSNVYVDCGWRLSGQEKSMP